MDKKNKIFFIIFFGAIFLSVFATWYRYFVSRDYYIQVESSCDPEKEVCFEFFCDPEADEECPEDEFEQASYYKLIRKKAYLLPPCDPGDEHCPDPQCAEGEKDCQEILCSEDLLEEGISCSNSEDYLVRKEEYEKRIEEAEAEEEAEAMEEDGENSEEGMESETTEEEASEDGELEEEPQEALSQE